MVAGKQFSLHASGVAPQHKYVVYRGPQPPDPSQPPTLDAGALYWFTEANSEYADGVFPLAQCTAMYTGKQLTSVWGPAVDVRLGGFSV